jgi:hypothetical protein
MPGLGQIGGGGVAAMAAAQNGNLHEWTSGLESRVGTIRGLVGNGRKARTLLIINLVVNQ